MSALSLQPCAGFQTDFSVTNRLLPTVGYGNGSPKQQDRLPPPPPAWQPSEQDPNYSSSQQPWTGAPNTYYPYSAESSLSTQSRYCTSGAMQYSLAEKIRKSAGDVPLHHESTYFAESYSNPHVNSLDPVSIKGEPNSPAPKSGGSNSTTSKSQSLSILQLFVNFYPELVCNN